MRVLTKTTAGVTAAAAGVTVAAVAIVVVPVGLAGVSLHYRRKSWLRRRNQRQRERQWGRWNGTAEELTPHQKELLDNWREMRRMTSDTTSTAV